MNLLLDSQALVWAMQANPNLSSVASTLVLDPANRLHLSVASVWELGIKAGLKKLVLNVQFATFLTAAVTRYGLAVLPITADDCIHYEALPFPNPNHRDPFDRMIITHAVRNQLSIVGADVAFDSYGVTRLW